jgi:hypothetical protein
VPLLPTIKQTKIRGGLDEQVHEETDSFKFWVEIPRPEFIFSSWLPAFLDPIEENATINPTWQLDDSYESILMIDQSINQSINQIQCWLNQSWYERKAAMGITGKP